MLQRGRAVFAGATGLKGLLDFVAVVKAEATALAQTLDGIAKLRSGALSVAATLVSVSSKISKAYVMNNLGTSAITSDSGKLRFLYDEVLAKARNGEGVDRAGMPEEPVDTIPEVGKFASRDVMKTGLPLLDTGPMEYAIDVSPDESAVTVHAKSVFPVHADVTLPTTMIGTCTISQDFVIDLSGEDPEIRDFKIGQALE